MILQDLVWELIFLKPVLIIADPVSLPERLEICDRPSEYVYWDHEHRTTKTHQLIADYAHNFLVSELGPGDHPASVPEPTSWLALTLFGFGLIRKKV